MLLILPNENVDDLNMKNLNFGRLKSRLFPATVMLTLPRFKTKQTIQLKDALEELGVSAIFDRSSANLTDIANDDGLFVSDVSHKAFVEVNEAGSEAAAATSIQIDTRSGPVDTVRLAFNKPFLFIIQVIEFPKISNFMNFTIFKNMFILGRSS
jgi:serpin B